MFNKLNVHDPRSVKIVNPHVFITIQLLESVQQFKSHKTHTLPLSQQSSQGRKDQTLAASRLIGPISP